MRSSTRARSQTQDTSVVCVSLSLHECVGACICASVCTHMCAYVGMCMLLHVCVTHMAVSPASPCEFQLSEGVGGVL